MARDGEGRSPGEIANEATKRYLTLRRLQAVQQYGQGRAEELGITEGDVSRLISDRRPRTRLVGVQIPFVRQGGHEAAQVRVQPTLTRTRFDRTRSST